ncbi:MAG TPA: amidohydrolase [Candidatus Copromonas faecavium]|uniref:Amidohydrolase n=1 Tax=Candidatus Copromonas faecavium (nom. illeg.) TaxID=2840740 RepID=A0A9D1D5P8_9FIRM|nr:amidohydrolase [Candidatus Copromonas faecavium]
MAGAFRDEVIRKIEESHAEYTRISDEIWGYAEPRFQEEQSSRLQQEYLKSRGFSIRADLAGEKTAFIAEYGSGKPVIAFLGEFDALSSLEQEADCTERRPIPGKENGHGCGHHLLGTASVAAVDGLKAWMEEKKLSGTIRYYGCPAEENAGGKAFLVRDGFFDDCDIALTWHPYALNKVMKGGFHLANFRVFFTFHGISSHAAGAPELGRSALDAVEIMDIGVNYMREHMIDAARVHGAITNSGGIAPNVIPSEAQILYAIRAPKVTQVKKLYERMCDIAKGAALITGTTVEIKQVAAYSDVINNDTLADLLQENLEHVVPIGYTDEELAYAKKFQQVITELDREGLKDMAAVIGGKEGKKKLMEMPLWDFIVDKNSRYGGGGSTDVGDVSWVVPTGQVYTNCYAAGTAMHSWQAVAQGKSAIAHKGMMAAAKVMAMTGAQLLLNPDLVEKAKADWKEELDGETYPSPLPKDSRPEIW